MKKIILILLGTVIFSAFLIFYFGLLKQTEEFKILKEETIFLNESFGVKM